MADSFGNNGNGAGHDPTTVIDVLDNELTNRAGLHLLDKRGDGNILGNMSETQLGALQKLATAPEKDDDYRQILLLARFKSAEDANLCVNALAWANRYKADPRPILDKVLAQNGVKGAAREDVIAALTHLQITHNTSNKNGNRSSSGSPLR